MTVRSGRVPRMSRQTQLPPWADLARTTIPEETGSDRVEVGYVPPVHDRRDYALLSVGVLCASTSPPLIAACAAPALAIAFWRTGAAALIILPVLLARREHRGLHRRAALLAVLAGAALAAHFGTFIPSLSYTSVASAAALVCSQAVWAALLGRVLGERLPRPRVAGHRASASRACC